MSASVDVLSPAPAPPRRRKDPAGPPRRRAPLVLVPLENDSAARAPFIAAVVSLLVGGLLGLLVLNTVLARDAFALHSLKVEDRVLTDREQGLQREVEALRSPQSLSARATQMGMISAGPPSFLRLADGTVLGTPVAGGEPIPAVPRVRKR